MAAKRIILPALLLTLAAAQTNFTLPNNAWRYSVRQSFTNGNWQGHPGYDGVGPQRIILEGYGRRYFDHRHPNAYYDLYNLDSLSIRETTFGDLIRAFNSSSSAAVWGDTLPDFSTEFFGDDSIEIGGYLYNPEYSRITSYRQLTLEYGVTNRVTFKFELPVYDYLIEKRAWRWEGLPPPGLEDFLSYHNGARDQFDSLNIFFAAYPMDEDTLIMLQSIDERLYRWEGTNSVLWALAGGLDPLETGLAGPEFNPFSADDSATTTIDELIQWYLPTRRTARGLGDVDLNLIIQLAGHPAWSRSGFYSTYLRVGLRLPLAKRLAPFNPSQLDGERPTQFTQLAFGCKTTGFSLALLGEFYRTIRNNLWGMNWEAGLRFYASDFLNFPVTMLGTNQTNPDTIMSDFSDKYCYRPGIEIWGRMAGNLELVSERLWLQPRLNWYFKGRDNYFSIDRHWEEFRETRSYQGDRVFDTRAYHLRVGGAVIFRNLHPLHRWGPIPFEIEVGASLPLLTRHQFAESRIWISLATYLQAW